MFGASLLRFCRLIRLVRVVTPCSQTRKREKQNTALDMSSGLDAHGIDSAYELVAPCS